MRVSGFVSCGHIRQYQLYGINIHHSAYGAIKQAEINFPAYNITIISLPILVIYY